MSSKIRSMAKARAAKNPAEITVTLNTLLYSQEALGALIAEPLPARQAFELGKTVKAINSELEAYQTTRKALCERFSGGKMKNEDREYDIPEDQLPAFEKELADLRQSEVQLQMKPISLESLHGIKIRAGHIMQLDWLIAE